MSHRHLKPKGVLVAQSRPALCNLMDYSLPGSSVHEILQARIPEWVAIPFSGIEPKSPALQADSSPFEPPEKHPSPKYAQLNCFFAVSVLLLSRNHDGPLLTQSKTLGLSLTLLYSTWHLLHEKLVFYLLTLTNLPHFFIFSNITLVSNSAFCPFSLPSAIFHHVIRVTFLKGKYICMTSKFEKLKWGLFLLPLWQFLFWEII